MQPPTQIDVFALTWHYIHIVVVIPVVAPVVVVLVVVAAHVRKAKALRKLRACCVCVCVSVRGVGVRHFQGQRVGAARKDRKSPARLRSCLCLLLACY